MSKFILGLSIFCAVAASAFAGPVQEYSGKEMKQMAAAPPPPCPSWTGFYIGAFGGYKFSNTGIDPNLGGFWNGPTPTDPFDKEVIEPITPNDLDTSGAELGGLIGYNYQWNNWVFGVEAAGGYLWLRDSDNTGVFTVPATDNTYSVATSLKTHYLATFGGRIGYAFCRWLPYVTGGLAVGDIDFEQTIIQHNLLFNEVGHTDDAELGWMVGGGLEYALTNHWRIRAQYQYVDLGSGDFHSVGAFGNNGYTADSSAELREHNVSFALIYGF